MGAAILYSGHSPEHPEFEGRQAQSGGGPEE